MGYIYTCQENVAGSNFHLLNANPANPHRSPPKASRLQHEQLECKSKDTQALMLQKPLLWIGLP